MDFWLLASLKVTSDILHLGNFESKVNIKQFRGLDSFKTSLMRKWDNLPLNMNRVEIRQ